MAELLAPRPGRPGRWRVALLFPRHCRSELWWLHEGNRAIRIGDGKLVAAGSAGQWELDNLASDRSETHNLADQHPDVVKRLAKVWTNRFNEFRKIASQDLPGNR